MAVDAVRNISGEQTFFQNIPQFPGAAAVPMFFDGEPRLFKSLCRRLVLQLQKRVGDKKMIPQKIFPSFFKEKAAEFPAGTFRIRQYPGDLRKSEVP